MAEGPGKEARRTSRPPDMNKTKNMETSNKEVIRLEHIRRDFHVGDEVVHALRDVSFTILEGEFVTIMGTSGSGKSTLLNTLGCLDTPTSGEYYLDGVAVRTMDKNQRATLRNRKIGFVFQNYNLLPKTTAIENVELPLMYNPSCSAAERYRRSVEALRAVGLGDRLLHRSNQMSGGQMQRVAIARALVNNPAVILADEATGNNKLRGFLTMLGIIIGVASVITMLAIGQGSKRSIQAEISEMGSNMIMIHPGGDMRGGVRLDADDMESLKLKDLEDIRNNTRFVTYVSPSVNSAGQAIVGANNTPTTIYGVNTDYLEIRRYRIADGDTFSEQDIRTAAKVCLVGQTVVDELFPDGTNPVGRVIRFGTIPLRIVGVLESKGYNSMGMDQDDLILAPYTTVQKRIPIGRWSGPHLAP